ncbi:unnamed protein product [Pleuronectes platessa]|uniref:Uncharacterized protein n=1 Tax=Pleuronectes platessa TaxID=8262 RepID=A0A9N7V365_PLEPL|nr:unnamed protein product [Pleuronectes platessa]
MSSWTNVSVGVTLSSESARFGASALKSSHHQRAVPSGPHQPLTVIQLSNGSWPVPWECMSVPASRNASGAIEKDGGWMEDGEELLLLLLRLPLMTLHLLMSSLVHHEDHSASSLLEKKQTNPIPVQWWLQLHILSFVKPRLCGRGQFSPLGPAAPGFRSRSRCSATLYQFPHEAAAAASLDAEEPRN